MHPAWHRYLVQRGKILRVLLCVWGLGAAALMLGSCLVFTTGPFKLSGGPGMPECIECVPTDPPMNCCPAGYGERQESKQELRVVALHIAAAAPVALAITPLGLLALLGLRNSARKKMTSGPTTF